MHTVVLDKDTNTSYTIHESETLHATYLFPDTVFTKYIYIHVYIY